MVLFLVIIALVLYSFLNFLGAGRDDTFIMLWSGQTLGNSPWFINFNDVPQEISSSTIGALIAAATKGQSVETALMIIKMLGLSSAIMAFYVIWTAREDIFKGFENKNIIALAVIISTAASPVFMYWSMGGLETPYHALLLVIFCIVTYKSLLNPKRSSVDWGLAVVLILLVLVRTEAFWPIFLALFLFLFFGKNSSFKSPAIRSVMLASLFFLVLIGIRYKLTSSFWPNPVYAKIGDFKTAIPLGLDYLYRYLNSSVWASVQALSVGYGLFILAYSLLGSRIQCNKMASFGVLVSSVVIVQLVFVILSGGNWMEYFRFIAAIVPLLNILAFSMLVSLANKLQINNFKFIIAIPLIALSFTQIGKAKKEYGENCSKPIQLDSHFFDAIKLIPKYALNNNCAHSRDLFAIKPFIDGKIPELLAENNGQLTIASYQAGFFPYYIRQRYDKNQVWFIDTAGLTDLEIARLPGGRNSFGIAFSDRIDLALLGHAGLLAQYLATHPVQVVYQLGATAEMRENFRKLGFTIIVDTHGAVVFYRKKIKPGYLQATAPDGLLLKDPQLPPHNLYEESRFNLDHWQQVKINLNYLYQPADKLTPPTLKFAGAGKASQFDIIDGNEDGEGRLNPSNSLPLKRNTDYVASILVKNNHANKVEWRLLFLGHFDGKVSWDFNANSLSYQGHADTTNSGAELCDNGWVRLWVRGTTGSAQSGYEGPVLSLGNANNQSVYLYNVSLEEQSYPANHCINKSPTDVTPHTSR